jgi:hypothetical protein
VSIVVQSVPLVEASMVQSTGSRVGVSLPEVSE